MEGKEMRDERTQAARTFLWDRGYDLPFEVLTEMFEAVKDKSPTVYEVNDFVVVNLGMGEAGYGVVEDSQPGIYFVKLWSHDPDVYPEITHAVAAGDVKGLSSLDEAAKYHLERSGQIAV
jgi:hypothetical protein